MYLTHEAGSWLVEPHVSFWVSAFAGNFPHLDGEAGTKKNNKRRNPKAKPIAGSHSASPFSILNTAGSRRQSSHCATRHCV